jgi:preprotein translocase subunit SecG
MIAVLLTAHSLIVLALIGVVLLQRHEGGALGIGGGGGFMTGRGTANVLTRTTSILAACFFATSLLLASFAGRGESEEEVLRQLTTTPTPGAEQPAAPTGTSTEDLLKTLGAEPKPEAETKPDSQTPQESENAPSPSSPSSAAPAPTAQPAAPTSESASPVQPAAPPTDAPPPAPR